MNTRNSLITLAGLFLFALVFTACDKTTDNTPDLTTAEDDALASLMFDDVYNEVEDAMSSMENSIYGGQLKSAAEITCKTITVEQPDDSTFWPRTVTIDYGEGCTGPDGRTRKGKIVVVVNGRYADEGYSRSVTFDNFYVDNYKIEGTRTVTNEGRNDSGNITFSVVLTDGKVIAPDGTEMTRSYDRVREWVAGSDTPRYRWDDEYLITGEATGVNHKGVAYTRTIIDPLHVSQQCRWILSGSVKLVSESHSDVLLDYGDGTCDRIATVTVNDVTKTIRLYR